MRIEVNIVGDNGDVLATHTADASQPSMWRPPAGQRFVSDMPRQSDQPPTGSYELYGITFQPHLRIDRPNGYVSPPPSIPFTGNFPSANPFPSNAKTLTPYPSTLSGPAPLKGF